MDFEGARRIVLKSKGQENVKHKPKQKEALEAIAANKQDCWIVRPTGYGKSLIYQLRLSHCEHKQGHLFGANKNYISKSS